MGNRKATGMPSVQVEGRKITLADFPIVAYSLNCGHVGRERAIRAGDTLFCDTCQDTKRVATIISR
jgi:hypothetical protein